MYSGGTLLFLHGRLGVTVKLKGADRGPTVRQCLLVAETTALPPKLVGGYVFVYRPSLCCHVSSLHPFLHAGLVQGFASFVQTDVAGQELSKAVPTQSLVFILQRSPATLTGFHPIFRGLP